MIENVEIKGEQYQSPSSQIVELIKSQVSTKKLRPGEKLPPVRELGKIVGVGNYSVRQAFARLSKEGIINTIRGSGTFVASQKGHTGSRSSAKTPRTFCIISAFHGKGTSMELYHPATTAAILDECKEMNIKGRFLSPNINLSSLDDIVEEMKERSYDGAIWLYPVSDQWSAAKSLYNRNIPVVATSHYQYAVDIPCVQGNEVGTGQVTGRYLVNCGCKKVIFVAEEGDSSGNIKDVRSAHHIGGKIGLLNAFEEAGVPSPKIIDGHFTNENYKDMLKELLEHVDKKTCLMLANTMYLQNYLKEDLADAVSLFSKCELVIATAEKTYHLLDPLAQKVDFMVSVYPLQHIGKAAVHKLANIIDGKFEDTTTLVNGIFEKFNAKRKKLNNFSEK